MLFFVLYFGIYGLSSPLLFFVRLLGAYPEHPFPLTVHDGFLCASGYLDGKFGYMGSGFVPVFFVLLFSKQAGSFKTLLLLFLGLVAAHVLEKQWLAITCFLFMNLIFW